MSTISFRQHTLIVASVTVALTICYAYCYVEITGGTDPFSVYRKTKCKIVVDGNVSVPASRIVRCALLCSVESSCSAFHYHDNDSLCMIDARPANALVVDATPGENFWTSYLRHQYTIDCNWTQLDSSCYHVTSDVYTWTECDSYCQSHSSHLATIRSDREVEFALGIINKLSHNIYYLHIGGKQNPDNTWSWINGEHWDFTWWHPSEPSHVTETCLAFFSASRGPTYNNWNDIYCSNFGYCLCEKSADSVEPPSLPAK